MKHTINIANTLFVRNLSHLILHPTWSWCTNWISPLSVCSPSIRLHHCNFYYIVWYSNHITEAFMVKQIMCHTHYIWYTSYITKWKCMHKPIIMFVSACNILIISHRHWMIWTKQLCDLLIHVIHKLHHSSIECHW